MVQIARLIPVAFRLSVISFLQALLCLTNGTTAQPRGQDLPQAADDIGGDQVGGAGEEGLGECWEGVVAMGVTLDGQEQIDTQ